MKQISPGLDHTWLGYARPKEEMLFPSYSILLAKYCTHSLILTITEQSHKVSKHVSIRKGFSFQILQLYESVNILWGLWVSPTFTIIKWKELFWCSWKPHQQGNPYFIRICIHKLYLSLPEFVMFSGGKREIAFWWNQIFRFLPEDCSFNSHTAQFKSCLTFSPRLFYYNASPF